MTRFRLPRHLPDDRTFGQRAADQMARWMGSWRGIFVQGGFLLMWFAYNGYAAVHWFHTGQFDPAPFFIANLLMSSQASLTGPIILLSQNRQSQVDREHAEASYGHTNEILALQHKQMKHLEALVARLLSDDAAS